VVQNHQFCSLDTRASGRARAWVTPPLLCEITERIELAADLEGGGLVVFLEFVVPG